MKQETNTNNFFLLNTRIFHEIQKSIFNSMKNITL